MQLRSLSSLEYVLLEVVLSPNHTKSKIIRSWKSYKVGVFFLLEITPRSNGLVSVEENPRSSRRHDESQMKVSEVEKTLGISFLVVGTSFHSC